MELKNVRRGRIKEYADKFKGAVYTPVDPKLDHNPLWNHKADCAFPSATQNEINGKDAEEPASRTACYVVAEGANMPTTPEGVDVVPRGTRSSTAPARPPTPAAWPPPASRCRRTACASAGRARKWTQRLHGIMKAIHKQLRRRRRPSTACPGNYVNGANIAGFLKVADAMLDQGVV